MPMQLTPEQEQRLQAVVNAGAYASADEALDAALAVVERAAVQDFEGSPEDLERLLLNGLASKELSEDEFWSTVDEEISALVATHKSRQRS